MPDRVARFQPPDFSSRSPIVRYGFGVAAIAVALIATWLARGALDRTIFVLFFAAVTTTALVAGLGPAVLGVVLSVVAEWWFLVDPVMAPKPFRPREIFASAVLVGFAVMARWLNGTLQRHVREATAQSQRLERTRGFLAQAQAIAQVGSWEWDIGTNAVAWSDEMFRIYGVDPAAGPPTYSTFIEGVHPEDRARITEAIQEAIATRGAFAHDHRVIRPDGSVRWLEGRGKSILNDAGEVVGMAGSGQDVTERRRSGEMQRILSEASNVLAGSLDLHVTLDSIARLAVRDIADWCYVALGDASGRYETVAVAHRDPARTAWARDYAQSRPAHADATSGVPQVLRSGKTEFHPDVDSDGAEFSTTQETLIEWMRVRSMLIAPMTVRGRTFGAITFVTSESGRQLTQDDVWLAERLAGRAALAIDNARLFAEAVEARADAEHANQSKLDFLAAMSHDLRTPLNAIAGYADLLLRGVYGPLGPTHVQPVQRIERSREHLTRLVEQILSFTTIQAGRITYNTGDFAVSESISNVAELVAPQVELKRIAMTYDVEMPTPIVHADPGRFEQVLVNLLSNAVKYTADGGRVSLRVVRDGEQVRVDVTDTGIGIEPERLDAIFGAFVQFGPKETRRQGVGLGLAIARELTRAMNGRIAVVSQVGVGSTFSLWMPAGSSVDEAANTSAMSMLSA